MIRKLIVLLTCFALSLTIAGCASSSKSNGGSEYIDSQAMDIIAKGWEERSVVINSIADNDPDYSKKLKKAVQTEFDICAPLREEKFKDPLMQEAVLSYVDLVDAQLKLFDSYPEDSYDFDNAWYQIAVERAKLLNLLVNDYGLTVGKKYQDDFEEVLALGITG